MFFVIHFLVLILILFLLHYRDLISYLTGEIETCANIVTPSALPSSVAQLNSDANSNNNNIEFSVPLASTTTRERDNIIAISSEGERVTKKAKREGDGESISDINNNNRAEDSEQSSSM